MVDDPSPVHEQPRTDDVPRRPRKVLLDIGEPRVPIVTSVFLIAAIILTAWEFIRFGASPSGIELSQAGGWGLGAFVNGSWWKAVTANLLHGSLVHVAMNAFVIYLVGRWVEHVMGAVAVVAIIAWAIMLSSAGALLIDAAPVTIGASGVAFALVGAGIVTDPRQRTMVGGISVQLGVLNLVLTFVLPGISKGGHLGGLIAGLVVALVIWRRGGETERATPLGQPRRVGSTVAAITGSVLVLALLVAPETPPAPLDHAYSAASARLVTRMVASSTFGDRDQGFSPTDVSCDATSSRARFVCDYRAGGERQIDKSVTFDSDDQLRIESPS